MLGADCEKVRRNRPVLKVSTATDCFRLISVTRLSNNFIASRVNVPSSLAGSFCFPEIGFRLGCARTTGIGIATQQEVA
jgi:hypothetical protein